MKLPHPKIAQSLNTGKKSCVILLIITLKSSRWVISAERNTKTWAYIIIIILIVPCRALGTWIEAAPWPRNAEGTHSKPPSPRCGHRPKLCRRSAADAPTTGKVSKRTSCFTSSVTTANQYLAKPFIKLNLMWCQIREENEQERKNKKSYIFSSISSAKTIQDAAQNRHVVCWI